MEYDLTNAEEKIQYKLQSNHLYTKKARVELSELDTEATTKQKASVHVFCQRIADYFNDFGDELVEKSVPLVGFSCQYTRNIVREHFWRPIQIAMYGKKSLNDLTKKEIMEIIFELEKYFATRGVSIAFPNKKDRDDCKKK